VGTPQRENRYAHVFEMADYGISFLKNCTNFSFFGILT
jgi:hypothetical protein